MALGEAPRFPGEESTPEQLRGLADEYRGAAEAAWSRRRSREPISLAPFRLLAVHAAELYLNAYLRSQGFSPADLRRLHHDLATRLKLAENKGLRLRRRTAKNVILLAKQREYLIARYAPERAGQLSQPNKITAILTELSRKVASAMNAVGAIDPAASNGDDGERQATPPKA